jgi:hypothetical protein
MNGAIRIAESLTGQPHISGTVVDQKNLYGHVVSSNNRRSASGISQTIS